MSEYLFVKLSSEVCWLKILAVEPKEVSMSLGLAIVNYAKEKNVYNKESKRRNDVL
jgi:hypothetical protein